MGNRIKINCEGSSLLTLNKIKPFQGDIKTLSDKNRERLKTSIIKYGFSCPFFIWENEGNNYLLDGHQRLTVLSWMKSDGWEIPELPVVYIQAETKQEAKQLLLHITSQYGKFSEKKILQYIQDYKINTENIRLSNSEIYLEPINFEIINYNKDRNEEFKSSYDCINKSKKIKVQIGELEGTIESNPVIQTFMNILMEKIHETNFCSTITWVIQRCIK